MRTSDDFGEASASRAGEEDALLAGLAAEYEAALREGRSPDRAAILARCPGEAAARLEKCLEGLRLLHGATPGGRSDDERGADPPTPETLGDFRLGRELGRGGMGVVYDAEQLSLSRRVALKVLPLAAVLDPRRLLRFQYEARAAASLSHPHIVPVYAVGSDRGVHYYAMQRIDGVTLDRVVREMRSGETKDRPSEVCELARGGTHESGEFCRSVARLGVQAAEALDHAHQQGVVHRDVKPANLMVDSVGALWVTDFGLASIQSGSATLTRTGDLLGTLRFMSPEIAAAGRLPVDHRTDVYSLGATLYEVLTLEPAVRGEEGGEVLRKIAEETPRPARRLNPAIPRDLETILQKAMAKEASERYASAREMAEDLERMLADRPIEARRPSPWKRAAQWSRRHRGLVGTALVALVLFAVGAAVFAAALEEKREEAESQRDDLLRLSDSKRVHDLLGEVDRLWPLEPRTVPAMAAWIAGAKEVLAGREAHRTRLARVRRSALPYDEDARRQDELLRRAREEEIRARLTGEGRPGSTEVPAAEAEELRGELHRLEAEGPERRTWTFPSRDLEWQHQVLSDLLADLDRLDGGGHGRGVFGEVEHRLDLATTLRRRSIEDHFAEWERTAGDVAASARYGGLRIAPQMGLIPLGPDPDSGLFEFAHVGSGSIPARDPGTQRLVYAEDAAIVLVLLPGGTFRMGAQSTDPSGPRYEPRAGADETPIHEVTLSPFFLAKHECTQAQWAALTGGLRPSFYAAGAQWGGFRMTDRHPVEQVPWEDCAKWLPRYGLDLPTEAQWEYSCRAGTETPWFMGSEIASLAQVANIGDVWLHTHEGKPQWPYSPEVNDGRGTHAPVGTYRPNPFGLYDVHGNVCEFCRDVYRPYQPEAQVDPVAGGSGQHLFRGGGWLNPGYEARSAERHALSFGLRNAVTGVRPARALHSD